MRARISWKRREEGGRRIPPNDAGTAGTRPYAAVIEFPDSSGPWPPSCSWSLVVDKIESESSDYEWIADVYYLVDEAPHDELRPLREFELYEGKRCVATGILLGEKDIQS